MVLYGILDEISIYYKDGTMLKSYAFHYNTYGLYSRLENVTLKDGNGNMLNPTVFEWGDNDHQKDTETLLDHNDTYVEEFFLDFNGDGKTDMIEATYDLVHYPNPAGYRKVYKKWYYRKRTNYGFSNRIALPGNIDKFFSRLLPGDFNGDGLTDLLYTTYFHEDYEVQYATKVLFSNGLGFDEKVLAEPVYCPTINKPELVIGDFDGNGIDELLVSFKDKNPNEDNTFIWQFKEEYPCFDVIFWDYISYGNKELENTTLLTGDFNGDGRTDLLRTSSWHNKTFSDCFLYEVNISSSSVNWIYSAEFPAIWHRIFTGDFNGDGITDILTYITGAPGDDWEIHCFNGKNSWKYFDSPPIASFDLYDDQYSHGIKIADFNGDGKSDIAEFEKENNITNFANYKIYYSKGYELEKDDPAIGQVDCHTGLNFMGGPYAVKRQHFSFNVDFNGDGRSDIYLSQGLYNDKIYLFDINNNQNSLLSITNGFGNRTEITYKPLTNSEVYTKGSSSQYPINDIQPPLYVVSSVVSDEELGADLKINYHYTGAKVHKCGKGFLGFSQTTVDNHSSNTTSTTNFSIFDENEKYYYPYVQTTEQKVTGTNDILLTSENFLNIKSNYLPAQNYTKNSQFSSKNIVVNNLGVCF